jgi:hypothetical protein
VTPAGDLFNFFLILGSTEKCVDLLFFVQPAT